MLIIYFLTSTPHTTVLYSLSKSRILLAFNSERLADESAKVEEQRIQLKCEQHEMELKQLDKLIKERQAEPANSYQNTLKRVKAMKKPINFQKPTSNPVLGDSAQ